MKPRMYERARLHLLFAMISILLLIWIPLVAGVWTIVSSLVMTAIAAFVAVVTYMLIIITPRHNDDIYYHVKDEKKHIRGGVPE